MLAPKEESVDPDQLDYPTIVQEALRDVVRRVLAQVAEHGVPGEHHFFIAFRTEFPGVIVPRFLRDLYPEETKIVLQHQFWDLDVDAELFSVTLTFNGQRQRLTIPFAALTVFVDPAAEFMLRFDGAGSEFAEEADATETEITLEGPHKGPRAVPDLPSVPDKPGEVLRFDPTRRK
jgi:hypothetical protein